MPAHTVDKALVDKVTRGLMDEGKIIQAGWNGLEMLVVSKDAPPEQRREMRMAFFAGAQHLFSSIIAALEEGDEEPTEPDLRRMDLIHKELEQFAAEFKMERTQ